MDNQSKNENLSHKQDVIDRKKIKFRYQLIDERRFNYLTVKDQLTGDKFQVHALELASNKTMMNEFCGWEARHIGVIAGHACFDPVMPADQC